MDHGYVNPSSLRRMQTPGNISVVPQYGMNGGDFAVFPFIMYDTSHIVRSGQVAGQYGDGNLAGNEPVTKRKNVTKRRERSVATDRVPMDSSRSKKRSITIEETINSHKDKLTKKMKFRHNIDDPRFHWPLTETVRNEWAAKGNAVFDFKLKLKDYMRKSGLMGDMNTEELARFKRDSKHRVFDTEMAMVIGVDDAEDGENNNDNVSGKRTSSIRSILNEEKIKLRVQVRIVQKHTRKRNNLEEICDAVKAKIIMMDEVDLRVKGIYLETMRCWVNGEVVVW